MLLRVPRTEMAREFSLHNGKLSADSQQLRKMCVVMAHQLIQKNQQNLKIQLVRGLFLGLVGLKRNGDRSGNSSIWHKWHDQNKSKGGRTFHCKVKKQTKNSTDILCIMYLEYLILQYHMGILNSSVPNLVSKLVLTLI